MKKLNILLPVIAFMFSVNNLFAQSSGHSDYVPTISADRRVDWHNVGDNQKPTSYNKVFNVLNYGAIPNDGADDRLSIQNAIDSARIYLLANPGFYAAVYLPQGTYNISSGGINLVNDAVKDYSNICLKGDGSDKTKLFFPSSYKDIAINISGRISNNNPLTIISGFQKGSNTITLNSGTQNYNIGDYVEIVNDFPLSFGQVGQIDKVVGKTGTQLILEDKLSIDYSVGSSLIQVRKLLPIKNVGIEDLIIERENTTGMWKNTIEYNYAAKCWILGVESFFTYKHHVDIKKSTFIEIKGSYFHHASGHGDGGIGYGVIIENHSTNCLIEDNLFDGLRHSMLVQTAANRNVFGYNHSWNREWEFGTATPGLGSADISIHGNYTYANLFEGNLVEFIKADDWWSPNGPYNTFVRNEVTQVRIVLESAPYTNAVGNYTTLIDLDNSENVLDVAAINIGTGSMRTHALYYFDPFYQLNCVCKDFSYYLDDFPPYFLQYPNVTWPPLGAAVAVINGLPGWPGGTIPAYERKIAGGKLTLNGTPLPLPLSVNITGPTTIGWGVDATWNASATGGNSPYHYQWWYKYPGGIEALNISSEKKKKKKISVDDTVRTELAPIGYWTQMQIDSPTLTRHDYLDHYLKCVVTDTDNTTVTSNIMYIYVNGSSGSPLSPLAKNDLQQNDLEKSVSEKKVTENSLGNYPNPFNPSTIIQYQIKEGGFVNVKVYDYLGREVAVLVNKNQPPGKYSVTFDASKLASGVYFYTINAKDFNKVKKMILLR